MTFTTKNKDAILRFVKQRLVRMSVALVAGLAGLYGLIWLLSLALGDRVSLYQGKPIEYWSERLNSPDGTASKQAHAVLSTEIIPHLTNAMFCDTNDSRLRLSLVDKLNDLPGILIYCSSADSRRASAATELGDLGLAAKPAGPALLQALTGKDRPVRGAAAVALGKTRYQPERIIPMLIALLDDQELNDEAAEALGEFGVLSKAAVPKLLSLRNTPDKDLRHAVNGALKKIDPAAAEAGVK